MIAALRAAEHAQALRFSVCRPFSEHLLKWEDAALPDKYDHNTFAYLGQPTEEEFRRALAYQKQHGAAFLKLEGDAPLEHAFGLEESRTLTMLLEGDPTQWRQNAALAFRSPTLADVEDLEVRHYAALYGEDFTRRNVRRLFETLTFHGAYLDGRLVGHCHTSFDCGCTCIDGLLVERKMRRQGVATALLRHVCASAAGTHIFLHADADDTPKDLYAALGFRAVDTLYEYLSTALETL